VDRKGALLGVRKHLTQIDVYCYLKARFGNPNGFQNWLRRDDSDNLIHWDFNIRAEGVDVYFCAPSREVHIMVSEPMSAVDWRDLILAIKADFSRVGQEKSKVLKSLEKWVVFSNKFCEVADLCAEHRETILENAGGLNVSLPAGNNKEGLNAHYKALEEMGKRASKLQASCLELSLLAPVFAESFLNMLILILCKREVRDNTRQFGAFIRSDIDAKIFDIPYKCEGFTHKIDPTWESYKKFKRVFDQRNNLIHGNVDPEREHLEVVFFEGKRPIFAQPGDHIATFFDRLQRQLNPEQVVQSYEDTYNFLLDLVNCLEPEVREMFWQVMNDPYPGFDVNRRKTGKLFPDFIVQGYMEGTTYDDELQVDW
jgi:hypothetical protein